jgi:hypothetical protein
MSLPTATGCPLPIHTSASPAPDSLDEYPLGGWMDAPLGGGRRNVCDACVRAIIGGRLSNYLYDEDSHEVTENR